MHCLQAVGGPYGLLSLFPLGTYPGNTIVLEIGTRMRSRTLTCSGDKIDAVFARLSALLAGCGPPITQDCITTIKSRISRQRIRVKLHRPDSGALPRALNAGTRRWSVMGGWRTAAGYVRRHVPAG